MIQVRQTVVFRDWMARLVDKRAVERTQRIVRLEGGLFGDARSVGGGVSELRIDYGPGYRVYFMRQGMAIVVLLCGGDKGGQARDIRAAKALAANLED
jgi:putative addiction module killer protein